MILCEARLLYDPIPSRVNVPRRDDPRMTYVQPHPAGPWIYGVSREGVFLAHRPDLRMSVAQIAESESVGKHSLGDSVKWMPTSAIAIVETINRDDNVVCVCSQQGKRLAIETNSPHAQQEFAEQIMAVRGGEFQSATLPVPWQRVSPVGNAMIVLTLLFTLFAILVWWAFGDSDAPTTGKAEAMRAIMNALGPWGIAAIGGVIVAINIIRIMAARSGLVIVHYTRQP